MSDEMTAARSAQEAAIARGRKVLHPGVTDRVLRLFDAIRSYGPPRVAPERAIYFTEYFKTTEGQPLVWRWANALKHIAENISVAIFDDELIVGRADTWLGRYSLAYPELDGFALALWNGKDSIRKSFVDGTRIAARREARGAMGP